MDLVGSYEISFNLSISNLFQSFWVNGFGWKFANLLNLLCLSLVSILLSQWIWLEVASFEHYTIPYNRVSILLSQWIWLEVWTVIRSCSAWSGFNPSESMDLVGSKEHVLGQAARLEFQSFWVNGFGWKRNYIRLGGISKLVSILLSQWIWLEATMEP